MKHCLTLLLLVLLPFFVVAQPAPTPEEQNFPDSLKQILRLPTTIQYDLKQAGCSILIMKK
jgi:hypothetical protein